MRRESITSRRATRGGGLSSGNGGVVDPWHCVIDSFGDFGQLGEARGQTARLGCMSGKEMPKAC
jgi:hypothetical protein